MTVLINDSEILHNTGTGIAASGTQTSIIVGNTTVLGNATGLSTALSAALLTYGDNRVEANPNLAPNNGSFSAGGLLPKK